MAFFSATAAEILGIFVPGHLPTVKINPYLSADLVAIHEQGHKELCECTGFGRYMAMLALSRTAKTRYADQAEVALLECIEQCWQVQEGYATMKQLANFTIKGEPGKSSRFEQSLPPSYLRALACFPIASNYIDDQSVILARHMGDGSNNTEIENALGGLARDYGSFVLAKSAMSIPIASIIRAAESLPSYEVSLLIRRHSPDNRLRQLTQHFSPQFVWRCVEEVLEGISEMQTSGTVRPIDARLERMVVELCAAASLPYEASDILPLQEIGSRLGMEHINILELDGRDLSLQASQLHQWRAKVIVRTSFDLEYVDAALALEAMREHFAKFAAEETHIMCEILPAGPDGRLGVWFHFFVDRNAAFHVLKEENYQRSEFVARSHTDAAFRTLLCGVRIEASRIALIPTDIPHNSWTWLLPHVLLRQYISDPLADQLETVGQLCAVGFGEHALILDSEVLYRAEPSCVAFPTIVRGVSKQHQHADAGKYEIPVVPGGLTLLTGQDPSGVQAIRLSTMDPDLSRQLPTASFKQHCLIECLSFGMMAFVASTLENITT